MNKELIEIIKYFESGRAETAKTVLVTVVDVQGSSYRLPGARMLVGENGEMLGTVSGGCLEADVLERATRVFKTGTAEIFTYDTTAQEDSVFSLNMGCRGVIRLLIEPIDGRDAQLGAWKQVYENRKRQLVATLISAKSATPFPLGGKILYGETGRFDFAGLPEFFRASDDLKNGCLKFYEEKDTARIGTYEMEEGEFEFFFELVAPPVNLIVFGAGADAVPVAETAKNLGWRVSVVDHRAAFANRERFRAADEIILTRPENLAERLSVDENTVAVVMSHNYEHDKNILRFLLESDVRYVGALGPKRRAENILREWREAGVGFSASRLEKLYAPVGLDIGGDTPETIALAVLAEIKSVLSSREGGHLRRREGSIYNR